MAESSKGDGNNRRYLERNAYSYRKKRRTPMLEWSALVTLYPFLKDIASKLPHLKESIEKASKNKTENPLIELQLESIQRIIDLQKTIEYCGYVTAKLSCPDAQKADVVRSREWATEVYQAIHGNV
jgi:hypothetical protein